MNKLEAKENTRLNQYFREKRLYCYYELKVARGGTFQFSKIEDSQSGGLPALEKEGLVWKLSDADMRQKPCDGFCTPPLPAYLIIKFGEEFHFVRFEKIISLRDSGRISIKKKESEEMADKIVKI